MQVLKFPQNTYNFKNRNNKNDAGKCQETLIFIFTKNFHKLMGGGMEGSGGYFKLLSYDG